MQPHDEENTKRYTHAENQGHRGVEEKAPSLADEFRRVAEEKAKAEEKTEQVADQGIASQTSDKTSDGAEEAATVGRGGGDTEAVKGRYKGHEPGADYRRRR
ncbi:uncharacterized protein LOC8287627 isoform X2 [Ricinus communis]|uniref:uncharacterized protein LOC8287627 isoform X2 n=1 Tax=Ricinus communis TaxID=3988 RepID=UPI00201B34DB|nr:uncharacterized protein LOC8287627 isoform X2 [Ricinus communis]